MSKPGRPSQTETLWSAPALPKNDAPRYHPIPPHLFTTPGSLGCDGHPDLLPHLSWTHVSSQSLSDRLGWAKPRPKTGPSSQEEKSMSAGRVFSLGLGQGAAQPGMAAATAQRTGGEGQMMQLGCWESGVSKKQLVGNF